MREKRFPDIFVLIAIGILFLLGVFVLYTTIPVGAVLTSWIDSLVARQLLFGFVCALVIILLVWIDPQISKTLVLQLLAWGGVALLLLCLFLLGPIVNNTHRWFHFGQFLFQPSEFAKIVTALWVAFWLTNEKLGIAKRVLFSVTGILVFAGLIYSEPDLGSTVVILCIMVSMLVCWAVKYDFARVMLLAAVSLIGVFAASYFISWFFLILVIPLLLLAMKKSVPAAVVGVSIGSALIVLVFGSIAIWNSPYRHIIPDYMQRRITIFTGENTDPDEKFQSDNAKIAVGSGEFWGKGLAQGTQSRLRFLPEYTTDFIFSAFIEERGYAGMILLTLVYLFLFARLLFLALTVEDEYARLVIIGLVVKLWIETFINIGMNMGILPTKGVALPFMSYGGSSLLANSIIIGIILSLYRFEAKRGTI